MLFQVHHLKEHGGRPWDSSNFLSGGLLRAEVWLWGQVLFHLHSILRQCHLWPLGTALLLPSLR